MRGPNIWVGSRSQEREGILREPIRLDLETDIVGIFPVTFLIANERTTMHDVHPIRRRHPDIIERQESGGLGPGGEEFVADAYADLANLRVACVNAGMVLHEPKDQQANNFLPDVGTYTQAKRGASWRWVRLGRAWEAMNRIMQRPDSGMDRAGLTAEELRRMWGCGN